MTIELPEEVALQLEILYDTDREEFLGVLDDILDNLDELDIRFD